MDYKILRHRERGGQADQQMHMIRHATNTVGDDIMVTVEPEHIIVEVTLMSLKKCSLALVSTEDDMVGQLQITHD